jgi:hypothetical protein
MDLEETEARNDYAGEDQQQIQSTDRPTEQMGMSLIRNHIKRLVRALY